ncbi:hypothetical protein C8P69_1455, partial [Phreatobacter oligotrophus]
SHRAKAARNPQCHDRQWPEVRPSGLQLNTVAGKTGAVQSFNAKGYIFNVMKNALHHHKIKRYRGEPIDIQIRALMLNALQTEFTYSLAGAFQRLVSDVAGDDTASKARLAQSNFHPTFI